MRPRFKYLLGHSFEVIFLSAWHSSWYWNDGLVGEHPRCLGVIGVVIGLPLLLSSSGYS